MNRRITPLLAASAILFAGASVAKAEFIQWQIDTALSKLTLNIPDAVLNLDGTIVTARVRNETGTSNTWSVGNSAGMKGIINTDYKEVGQHNIQYLTNPLGQWQALNSGNYRPNPNRYNPTSTDATNTQGMFTGSNSQDFPAVFAAKLRATANVGITTTLDAAYMDIYNVFYNMTSGVLPISGVSGGNYSTATATVGIADANIALDGFAQTIIIFPVPQIVPDTLDTLGNVPGVNSGSGTSTIVNTGGNNRRMTIPISVPAVLDVGGLPLNITLTGTVVANSIGGVPEPSTIMMAGVGIVALSAIARRKYMKRRAA